MKTSTFIKDNRKRIGLSQVELAKLLGVKPVNICKWERGYTDPPSSIIWDVMVLVEKAGERN